MNLFIRNLTDQGCHRDVAKLIVKQYPPVWKWFVLTFCKSSRSKEDSGKIFFEKYLPTPDNQRQFMCELATHGLLKLLQWAHLNKCFPQSSVVCMQAAKYGHLNVLKWARQLSVGYTSD